MLLSDKFWNYKLNKMGKDFRSIMSSTLLLILYKKRHRKYTSTEGNRRTQIWLHWRWLSNSLMLISADVGKHLLVDMSSLWQVAWQHCAPKPRYNPISRLNHLQSHLFDSESTSTSIISYTLQMNILRYLVVLFKANFGFLKLLWFKGAR